MKWFFMSVIGICLTVLLMFFTLLALFVVPVYLIIKLVKKEKRRISRRQAMEAIQDDLIHSMYTEKDLEVLEQQKKYASFR